jgi:hypothetical protein
MNRHEPDRSALPNGKSNEDWSSNLLLTSTRWLLIALGTIVFASLAYGYFFAWQQGLFPFDGRFDWRGRDLEGPWGGNAGAVRIVAFAVWPCFLVLPTLAVRVFVQLGLNQACAAEIVGIVLTVLLITIHSELVCHWWFASGIQRFRSVPLVAPDRCGWDAAWGTVVRLADEMLPYERLDGMCPPPACWSCLMIANAKLRFHLA